MLEERELRKKLLRDSVTHGKMSTSAKRPYDAVKVSGVVYTSRSGWCPYYGGHVRSEGSEGTMSCVRVAGEKTTRDVTVTSWMTCAQQSFHGSIQTAVKDEVSMNLTSARSDCAVSGVVIRIVL